MHRSTLGTFLFICWAISSPAQWHGGPLTIIAGPGSVQSAIAPADLRGGPPPNDLCQNATITLLPQNGTASVSGDNTGATDTEDFGNPNCWEAFTIDTCSTVTVSYCGTSPTFGLVYSILLIGCPDPDVSVQNSDTTLCADGNVEIIYENLFAGTYYVPVLLWPGESEGPYTITFSSQVCDLPPANDRCVDAITVPVVADCADGTVAGNNALAIQQGNDPPCAQSNSPIQDVWYTFNSGMNDQVLITIGLGTIGDLGVQVVDACGGSLVACGTGDTSYLVNVDHNINYKVRVFSNNEFGLGGSFTICVTVPPPVDACDGGSVSLTNGDTTAVLCANEPPLQIAYSTAGSASYTLVLTDENDTIVQVLSGTEVNPATLAPGTYHVWGISHISTLQGDVPGQPISGVYSIGVCVELSADFVELIVDICQSISEATADAAMLISDDHGPVLIWLDRPDRMRLELYDMRGALLTVEQLTLATGEHHPLCVGDKLAHGLYALRAITTSGRTECGVFMR